MYCVYCIYDKTFNDVSIKKFTITYIGSNAIEGDSKQLCKKSTDCVNENETCHITTFNSYIHAKGFCVPRFCKSKADCPNIGHISNGLLHGWCNGGHCIYQFSLSVGR